MASEGNREYVNQYITHLYNQGMKKRTVTTNMYSLGKFLAQLDKDVLVASQGELEKAIGAIIRSDLADTTKDGIKKNVKAFLHYHKIQCAWIKRRKVRRKVDVDALLNEEDIRKLLLTAKHPRDRAIILLLWDCGIRTCELISMRTNSVDLTGPIPHVIVDGKTGPRRLPIHFNTAKAMADYLDSERRLADGSLWARHHHSNRKGAIDDDGVNKMLQELAHLARLGKRVTVYIFRHSVATRDAKYYKEMQLRHKFGWSEDSRMASVYVHLSARDLDEAMLMADAKMQRDMVAVHQG